MKYIFPDYYKEFECIKGLCRHNCCIGWEIDIDDNAAAAYASLKGPFGEKLKECIAPKTDDALPHFILGEKERCPFLNKDNLCEIIITLGENALCNICAAHPRFVNGYENRTETGLGLCCEAASTLILSKKEPVRLVDEYDQPVESDVDDPILLLRDRVIEILQDRTLSLSERLDKMLIEADCDFSVESIQENLCRYAKFLSGLERLDEEWTVRLNEFIDFCGNATKEDFCDFDIYMKNRRTEYEQLAVYFTYRYFALAPDSDYVAERAAFTAFSVLLIRGLGAARFNKTGEFSFHEQSEIARLFSSEIEYSEDNLYDVMGLFS
jgi:lysine-N-methylase